MKVGVIVPSFRDDASALRATREVEDIGLDGAFVFDHLWPMGQPDRPALSAFPLLGAMAASTVRIAIGTLVARVGLMPDEILVASVATLGRIAPGRVIVGMGTGDSKSAAENIAYGIAFGSSEERRSMLASCTRAVLDLGIPVWVGGGARATNLLAEEAGAAVNLWNVQPAELADQSLRSEVTWAGPIGEDVPQVSRRLAEISDAGATWAVCSWPPSLEVLAEAARSIAPSIDRG